MTADLTGLRPEHWIVLDKEPFAVFNDDGTLTMEPIDASDLHPITKVGPSFCLSAAWSAGCYFCFIVMGDGIALLNVFSGKGFFCRKRSAKFIELFVDRPRKPAGRRALSESPAGKELAAFWDAELRRWVLDRPLHLEYLPDDAPAPPTSGEGK